MFNDYDEEKPVSTNGGLYVGIIFIILAVIGATFCIWMEGKEIDADHQNCSGAIVKYYYAPNHTKIIHCLTVENGAEKIEVKQYSY